MEQLIRFFSPEAGQRRRAALEQFVSGVEQFIPPNLRPAAEIAVQMNPVQGISDAMSAGNVAFDPEQTAEARRRAAVDMGVEMAMALGPAALVKMGYLSAPTGLLETFSAPAVKEAARTSAGLLVPDDVAAKGDKIISMLKSGNGAKITDADFDLGNQVKNTQLNQYLSANYDIPLDPASRMQRARDMGFDVDEINFHGTAPNMYLSDNFSPDIREFNVSKRGQSGSGVYVAPDVRLANKFSGAGEVNKGNFNPALSNPKGGSILPVVTRNQNPANYAAVRKAQHQVGNIGYEEGSRKSTEILKNMGFSGAKLPNEQVVFDPENVRSIYGRFDPRLSHLKNILAAPAGLLFFQGALDQKNQESRDY
jgi:hypothetical protein